METTWIGAAEEYLGKHQWGPNGRFLGVSRMFKEEDLGALTKTKVFATQRPRGILSGFLAIVPVLGYAVYIPPIAGKVAPMRIRMRIRVEKGAIFSVYWNKDELILEDVLVWNDESIWFTKSFEERWGIMKQFIETCYKPDVSQGFIMKPAIYQSLQSLSKPTEYMVVEFIPNDPKQKRMIWTSERKQNIAKKEEIRAKPELNTSNDFILKKESNSGPDVYTVYRSGEKQGLALVKTLAISKALRNCQQEEINVHAEWNNQFGKWEIRQVLS